MRLSFAPSSYDRWSVCTASPAAVAGVKTERKTYSDEGNIAHELHAHCLMWGEEPRSLINQKITVKDIGEAEVTAEMAEAVEDSINYIKDQLGDVDVEVELEVSLDHLIPNQRGFADVKHFDGEVLHIIDLKYGKGIKVYAKNNGELMLHASGVVRAMSYEDKSKLKKIVIHIAQPRLEHFDKWEFTRGELTTFELNVVSKYQKASNPESAEFVPSPEGCQFCPIKADCRALKESIYAKVMGEDGELVDPVRLSNEELSEMFEWFDFISAWANNAREHMVKLAESGVQFPGLKMIPGKAGQREWKNEQDTIAWMKERGMEDFEIYESSLISPAKAETQIGKKNVGDKFKTLFTQRSGKPRLVKDSHASPSVTQTKLNDFDDVEV